RGETARPACLARRIAGSRPVTAPPPPQSPPPQSPPPPPQSPPAPAPPAGMAVWHRLHPLSPLIRTGRHLVALGILVLFLIFANHSGNNDDFISDIVVVG